ncbi:MAG: hypothetical protein P8X75_14545 [Limibacillus sp.]
MTAIQERQDEGGLDLRPASQVMRLARMGSFFPTRLSFMPGLIRSMNREGWRFSRPRFEIAGNGEGRAVYCVDAGARRYSLVAFAHALPDDARSDRVIAEAWDATFALYDGEPDEAELKRLAAAVPKQEAGRCRPSELVLSRANKSVRVFEHVAGCLAEGRQPDPALLASVGYLMRTTAVYGNGKFGIADRERIAGRPELAGPFRAEMLAVYLIRNFTLDLVEEAARKKAEAAGAPERFTRLAPQLRRFLGIGNSTGLGMAPFLINHPELINNWIAARETALARVRALSRAAPEEVARFEELVARAAAHVGQWRVEDARQSARIARLEEDLALLSQWLAEEEWTSSSRPWDSLYRRAEEAFSLEGQEMLVSLLLEPQGALVDDLTDLMAAPPPRGVEPAMTLGGLQEALSRAYDWALELDFAAPGAEARFWYVSEKKLEPRLGERGREAGEELESPLDIARQVQALSAALEEALAELGADASIAAFLLRHPELRHVVRRVQGAARHPYGEVRENLIAADCLPIDLLRCKLSFFGASKFDPKSDRWTRITLYQGAPLPEDLGAPGAEDWCLPVLERADNAPVAE